MMSCMIRAERYKAALSEMVVSFLRLLTDIWICEEEGKCAIMTGVNIKYSLGVVVGLMVAV